MIDLIDIIDEFWRKYQGNVITVPPYVSGWMDDAPVPPVVPPTTEVKKLTGYRYEASDADGHAGEWYFLSSSAMTGKIDSLSVGLHTYKYEKVYKGRDLWYGAPAGGTIRVRLKDGTVYESESEDVPAGGKRTSLKFAGNTNGNRPTFYTHGAKLKVGQKVTVKVGPVSKSFVAKTRNNGSIGYDWPDGTVVKNSDVRGRGVAVLIPAKYAGQSLSGWVEL